MSALDELKDEENYSGFRWVGNRSLQLEVVPEVVLEFAALREENDKLKTEMEGAKATMEMSIKFMSDSPLVNYLAAHPEREDK
jgi:hypothetical protein